MALAKFCARCRRRQRGSCHLKLGSRGVASRWLRSKHSTISRAFQTQQHTQRSLQPFRQCRPRDGRQTGSGNRRKRCDRPSPILTPPATPVCAGNMQDSRRNHPSTPFAQTDLRLRSI
jgi:hypothetical protein